VLKYKLANRGFDFSNWGSAEIQSALPYVQMHIIKCEGGIVVIGTRVFSWPQEEEEGGTYHVRKCALGWLCEWR